MATQTLEDLDKLLEELGTPQSLVKMDSVAKFANDLVKGTREAFSEEHGDGQFTQTVSADKPQVIADGFSITVNFAEYGDFLNEGVHGSKSSYPNVTSKRKGYTTLKPPASALESFAKKNGLNTWAVRESIFQKGIRASHWLDNYLDKGINKDIEKLQSGLVVDIENTFK